MVVVVNARVGKELVVREASTGTKVFGTGFWNVWTRLGNYPTFYPFLWTRLINTSSRRQQSVTMGRLQHLQVVSSMQTSFV
jgi:hypothetical protein